MKARMKAAAAAVLLIVSAEGLLAAPIPPEALLDMLYRKGVEQVQAGAYDEALAIADQLLKMNPAAEPGYRIAVAVYWARKEHARLIFTVQLARRNGIESLFLYSYLTQALYYVGGLSAALQGFRRIEDLLARQTQEQSA
jgi:tetratricopeptide (TPR) repeat protein